MKKYLARGMILLASVAFAQNPYGNQVFGPVVMTATSQTSNPVPLGNSWSSGTITLTGTSLTTVTFGVLASTDNGSSYFAYPICTVAASPTCATAQTATTNGVYQINLANVTHIKIVTSGTFTGTSISLILTASPNSSVSKNSSGGGGSQTINGTSPIVASTSGNTTTVSCPTCGLGTPVYVGGILRAMKYVDNSGTLRKVDIYNDPSIADYADGTVTGTFEWAINLLGTNGGLVSCYPGIYTTLTPLVIDWDWITIQGVNKPTWDNSGPAWPTHATPGTPGGCQITTPNAIQMVNIGTTLANMHGDSRHKAIKLNSLNFYGQYTATYGVYDMSHADSMEISENLFQGFQTEAIAVAWDSHQILYNSIQNNTGNGIDEQGMYGQIIGNITYDLGGTGIVVNAGAAQRQALIEGNAVGNVNVCIQLNGGSSVVQGNTLNANCGAISGVQNNGGTNQIYGNWWGGDNFFWHTVANGPFQVYGGSSFGQMQILSDTANTETDIYFDDNLSHTGAWLVGLNIFGSAKHFQMGSNASGGFFQAFDLDPLGNLTVASIIPKTIYNAAGTALPTCAVGLKGESAVVSDATNPLYMTAYTSGGAITAAVICSFNGTTYSWLTH